jgi:hypothetical protein
MYGENKLKAKSNSEKVDDINLWLTEEKNQLYVYSSLMKDGFIPRKPSTDKYSITEELESQYRDKPYVYVMDTFANWENFETIGIETSIPTSNSFIDNVVSYKQYYKTNRTLFFHESGYNLHSKALENLATDYHRIKVILASVPVISNTRSLIGKLKKYKDSIRTSAKFRSENQSCVGGYSMRPTHDQTELIMSVLTYDYDTRLDPVLKQNDIYIVRIPMIIQGQEQLLPELTE